MSPYSRLKWMSYLLFHSILLALSFYYHNVIKITCLLYSTVSFYRSRTRFSILFYDHLAQCLGEGNGTPLQHSCLENPMGGGAWKAAVHGVAKSRTSLSDFTFTFHFSLFTFMHWRRKWQPTPVFLPGESQGWQSLVCCRLRDRTESDMTEAT